MTDINPLWYMLFPTGVIGLLFLFLYEDGVPFSMYNKIRCKMGKHKFRTTISRIRKYYCVGCRTPRKHPKLKLIEGGGISNSKFRF